ncbi:phosphotransferase [Modestobacter sp. I12A-02628]|uniref:Phosphotransferase n=1 Tax=Goekera deserti TaxID=2497753 RepID=A0A7K3WB29_9ACTN|nr:phosphotransferase [Goekera deserti]MPQ97472.1 phosphotransferase [Goekera deserti]NDI47927.1 phosphotransferase [Goekera deserti]NEL53675.1 phosphotransferase [Goekera deserti]
MPPALPGSPRLPYAALPAGLRAAVDAALGSPVTGVSPRQGGFSPGPAAVLTCADGRRAFVKAVGTPVNADSVDILRAEGRVTAALPGRLPVPRLRDQVEWSDDGGDWIALLFDVQDGAPPALPWTTDRARTAMRAVDRFGRSATPCPVPGLRSLAEGLAGPFAGWRELGDAPDLDPWERDRLDWLAGAEQRLADRGGLEGDTLVHLDLRADNLLIAPDGELVLLD